MKKFAICLAALFLLACLASVPVFAHGHGGGHGHGGQNQGNSNSTDTSTSTSQTCPNGQCPHSGACPYGGDCPYGCTPNCTPAQQTHTRHRRHHGKEYASGGSVSGCRKTYR